MNQDVSRIEDRKVLARIHDGMKVYDRDGKEIGKVDEVYLGEESAWATEHGEGPATARNQGPPMQGVALARNPNESSPPFAGDIFAHLQSEDIPNVLRNRLTREGYIRMEAKGLFASDRYILPDQIANVSDDRVNLKTTRDELVKRGAS